MEFITVGRERLSCGGFDGKRIQKLLYAFVSKFMTSIKLQKRHTFHCA